MSDDDNLDGIKMEYSSGINQPFAIQFCLIPAANMRAIQKDHSEGANTSSKV